MKLFSRFSTRSKFIAGAVLTVAAAASFVAPAVTHADLGADRQTKAYVKGMPGFDHVQFNSFTGVPDVGDERQFLSAKVSGSTGPYYSALNGVQGGNELEMQVYVHNNADTGLNASGAGVAHNTRVRVVMPTGLAANQTAQAFVSADNAQPQVIEDDFTATGSSAFGLAYVPGSAHIKTNFQDVALSDDVMGSTGALIGDNNLNGDMPGCFEHTALVTFKVKVTAPSYSFQKHVKLDGAADTTYAKAVTAKSGDKVDFMLAFKNQGTTNLSNVTIGDLLPVGLTYVPNSTQWLSSHTANKWTQVSYDQWMKGGLGVGDYVPTGTGFVRFTATVDDESKLQCGMNRLTNMGFAKPEGQMTIQDSAEVDVTKTCATATPVYSCDLFDITKDESSKTVTVKTLNTTATGGTNFKSVDIYWGENGVNTLNTNTAVGKSHQYSGNGPFTITATAHFSTPSSDDVTATSTNCAKTVSFTTPVATAAGQTPAPTELVNTGSGNLFSLFAAVTIIGAIVHRLFISRRLAR